MAPRKGYTPRHQSKRWLDADCPQGILCLLDAGKTAFDRWTVVYDTVHTYDGRLYLFGRGMSDHPSHPQGFGCSIEFEAYQVARLRYQQRSTPWSTLPDDVKACIRRDLAPDGLGTP